DIQVLQRADGCFAAESGAFDEYVYFAHTVSLLDGLTGLLGRNLSGIGRTFFAAAETADTSASPCQDTALRVGKRNDSIIKCRQDMHLSGWNGALRLLLANWCWWGSIFCHISSPFLYVLDADLGCAPPTAIR